VKEKMQPFLKKKVFLYRGEKIFLEKQGFVQVLLRLG
jgi:hypothetical protein